MPKIKTIPFEVLEQAADWLVLMHSGQMTDQQHQQFMDWQAAHPDHVRAIERVEKLSCGLSQLPKQISQTTLLQSKHHFSIQLGQNLIVILASILLFTAAYKYTPWQLWQADVSSKVGEVKTITLDDNSTLVLASNSHINLHFDEHKREIELLQGEVYIQTAKEQHRPYRPFIVNTVNGSIQSLGTRFTVRQDAQHTDTQVQVYQHAVKVIPEHTVTTQIIQQGQQSTFTPKQFKPLSQLLESDPYWTQHLLVVDQWTLQQVLDELYRYHCGTFILDASARDIPISGVFSLKNPQQTLETLAKTYDLDLNFYSKYLLHVKNTKNA